MNLQHVEYFTVLAETEHMTRTAELLNTTQPNLSYAINQLELQLGVPLFKKVGRNLKLTQYGRTFYQYAKEALYQLNIAQEVMDDATNPQTGHINFGFIYTMGAKYVPEIVCDFQSKTENSKVDFDFFQGNSFEIIDLLKEEKIDIGLSSYIDEEPQVNFEPFIEQDIVLVAPVNHPLSVQDSVALKELDGLPFIGFVEDSGLRNYIDEALEQAGAIPDIEVSVEEDSSMLGFVSHGFGVAIMPDIPIIDAFPVKKIKITDTLDPRIIYLVTMGDSYKSPSLNNFYNFIKDYSNKIEKN